MNHLFYLPLYLILLMKGIVIQPNLHCLVGIDEWNVVVAHCFRRQALVFERPLKILATTIVDLLALHPFPTLSPPYLAAQHKPPSFVRAFYRTTLLTTSTSEACIPCNVTTFLFFQYSRVCSEKFQTVGPKSLSHAVPSTS